MNNPFSHALYGGVEPGEAIPYLDVTVTVSQPDGRIVTQTGKAKLISVDTKRPETLDFQFDSISLVERIEAAPGWEMSTIIDWRTADHPGGAQVITEICEPVKRAHDEPTGSHFDDAFEEDFYARVAEVEIKASAVDPDGLLVDHDCDFRRMVRLFAADLGVQPNANGNVSAPDVWRRLDQIVRWWKNWGPLDVEA